MGNHGETYAVYDKHHVKVGVLPQVTLEGLFLHVNGSEGGQGIHPQQITPLKEALEQHKYCRIELQCMQYCGKSNCPVYVDVDDNSPNVPHREGSQ